MARLVDDALIKKVKLVLEERGREVPELGRGDALNRERRFVGQGGGRVPGLDLLADDNLEGGGQGGVGFDVGDGGGGEGFEDFWGRSVGGWLGGEKRRGRTG